LVAERQKEIRGLTVGVETAEGRSFRINTSAAGGWWSKEGK